MPSYNGPKYETSWDGFDTAIVMGTAAVVVGCLLASVLLKNKPKNNLDGNNPTISTEAVNTNTEVISAQTEGYGTSFLS